MWTIVEVRQRGQVCVSFIAHEAIEEGYPMHEPRRGGLSSSRDLRGHDRQEDVGDARGRVAGEWGERDCVRSA